MSSKRSHENDPSLITELEPFFNSAVSVDCVIFSYAREKGSLQVLTLECPMPPFEGLSALVGDLIGVDEDLDSAAKRVVRERAQIPNIFLHQVHTFGSVDRHPVGRVITVAYYAFVRWEAMGPLEDNAHHPHWESLECLQKKKMAFDHSEILDYSVKHIQNHITDVPIEYMLDDYFTLSELQSLYEAILQKPLDKRNFRKKVFSLDLIRKTGKTQKNVAHRPAQLYKFNKGRKGNLL
jgi:8-oxo-dGTP diphosphatase